MEMDEVHPWRWNEDRAASHQFLAAEEDDPRAIGPERLQFKGITSIQGSFKRPLAKGGRRRKRSRTS